MTADSDDISGYQQRRAEIGEAIAGVERALSAPAGTGDAWYERVLAAFLELSRVAHTQRAATQGPDGLLAEISREKPVLAMRAKEIGDTFDEALAELDVLIRCATTTPADELREQALPFLGHAVRLRQAIADLLWEAYWVDVGGPG